MNPFDDDSDDEHRDGGTASAVSSTNPFGADEGDGGGSGGAVNFTSAPSTNPFGGEGDDDVPAWARSSSSAVSEEIAEATSRTANPFDDDDDADIGSGVSGGDDPATSGEEISSAFTFDREGVDDGGGERPRERAVNDPSWVESPRASAELSVDTYPFDDAGRETDDRKLEDDDEGAPTPKSANKKPVAISSVDGYGKGSASKDESTPVPSVPANPAPPKRNRRASAAASAPPWQIRWKRPELHPLVFTNGSRSTQPHREDLRDLTPLSSSSARLTSSEVNEMLRSIRADERRANYAAAEGRDDRDDHPARGAHGGDHSLWLDDIAERSIDSSGDSDGRSAGSDLENLEEEKEEEDCVLTVTVMASPSMMEAFGQGRGPSSSPPVGDVVLVEVAASSISNRHDDDDEDDDYGHDDDDKMSGSHGHAHLRRNRAMSLAPSERGVRLLLSEVFRWPSSALVEALGPPPPVESDQDEDERAAKDEEPRETKVRWSVEGASSAERDTTATGTPDGDKGEAPAEESAKGGSAPSGWDTFLAIFNIHRHAPTRAETRAHLARERARTLRRIRRDCVGVSSVALCRRPHRSSEDGASADRDDEAERASDALDAMGRLGLLGMDWDVKEGGVSRFGQGATIVGSDNDLASLPGRGGQNPAGNATAPSRESSTGDLDGGGSGHHQSGGEDDDGNGDAGDLTLCCLSNDGKVHVFDALSLLLSSRDETKRGGPKRQQDLHHRDGSHDDVMEDAFAALLLGRELLDAVKGRMLPLSDPEATVSLSVGAVRKEETEFIERSDGKSKDGVGEENHRGKESDKAATGQYKDDGIIECPPGSADTADDVLVVAAPTGPIDLSAFDSAVDPGTARYRTVRNVPTTCASAFDFVAVGGRGFRRMRKRTVARERRRRRSLDGVGTFEGESKANAGSEQDGNVDRSWEWKDVLVPGGFVTFVSLRHMSETRTAFLPFVPTSVSPVVWDNQHFVLVLGEDRRDGCHVVPRAVAVRVDSRRPKAPAESVGGGGGAESSSEPHGGSAGRGGPGANVPHRVFPQHPVPAALSFSARRFAPLPIILPVDSPVTNFGLSPSQLRPTALSVTSMLASPPSVAVVSTVTAEEMAPVMAGGLGDEDNAATMEREELVVALGSLCSIESPVFEKDYGWDRESLPPAVVKTNVRPGHVARIRGGQSVAKATLLEKSQRVDGRHLTPWCVSGQGWSLVGIPRGNGQHSHFFVSWEGATAAFGAYVQRLHGAELAILSERPTAPSGSVVCDVLPTDVFVTIGKNQRAHDSGKAKKSLTAASPVRLPFTSTSPFTKSFVLPDRLQKIEKRKSEGQNVGYTDFGMHRSDSFHEDEEEPPSDAGFDDIVITALDSITSMKSVPFREHHDPRNAMPHPIVGSAGPGASHRAKSALLLRHCSSWTQLDDNEENRALIDGQVIVACFRLGPTMQHYRSLTLRKNVITNGIATPFHQVLSWLCQRKDYFTAASVALNLLNDLEALRDLRGSPAGSNEGSHDERSYLEGLLDGIIPLEGSDFAACTTSITDKKGSPGLLVENMTLLHGHTKEKSTQTPSTVTSLADMAVGCLIRGGAGMSQTLEGFLGRNTYYDASRACLMLAATTANAISDQHEMNALSGPTEQSDESAFKCESSMENILWPIRCLLRIAVTRDCMPTALLLLNATIPNELRCRESRGSFGLDVDTCRPPLDLCIAVVKMIVASSSSAAGYLLSLSDEESHLSYWQSLDRDTQLSLSMISIQGKYPLLREAEVRAWALEEVSSNVEALSMPRDEETVLSSGWLKELCAACLSNAGCALGHLSSLGPMPSGSEEISDGISCRKEEMKFIRDALSPSPGTGGLDFDLLLPSLLLLQHRGVSWRDGASVSTQSILNMVCDLAGRQTLEEPSFAFDGVTVMKQCAIAENILGAAYLIGGQDGFILHCADVLIKSLGLSMKQAESVLLKKGLLMRETAPAMSKVDSKETISSSFELSDGHRYLLWLLDEHVFNVKTFGQFDASGVRGGIDPVFAARTCLRAWLCLMQSGNEGCSSWLVSWIRTKLGISVKGTVSKQRLACAALCRALLWPDDGDLVDWNDGKGGTRCSVLAEDLAFPCDFLVELAQACCGLIEAIPAPIAEEVLSGGQDSDEVGLTGRTIQV